MFDGAWPRMFDAKNTRDRAFHLGATDDGGPRRISVPTMYRVDELAYHEDEDASILEPPRVDN